MSAKDAARQAVFDAIGTSRHEIIEIGQALHANSEPAGDEKLTVERITSWLELQGFTIERGIAGLPTAFRARREHLDRSAMRKGARHAHIGLLMELDADSDLRHINGHNQGVAAILAAATGVGAALGHEHAVVTVYGCSGTDMLSLSNAGLFEELDVVLGAQPAPTGEGFCYTISNTGDTRGSLTVTIALSGSVTAATVSDAVTRLVAALDPLIDGLAEHESLTLTSDNVSVTGVIEAMSRRRLTEIAVEMQLAANDIGGPLELIASLTPSNVYDELVVNRILARRVKTFSDNLGPKMNKIVKGKVGGPTAWGNVSYFSPTYVAHYPITESDAAFGTANFASAANTPEAYEASMRIGECLAFTALDVIRDATFRAIADDQLVRAMGERGIERKHRRWTGLHPVVHEPKPDDEAELTKPKGPRVTELKWVRGPGMPNDS